MHEVRQHPNGTIFSVFQSPSELRQTCTNPNWDAASRCTVRASPTESAFRPITNLQNVLDLA